MISFIRDRADYIIDTTTLLTRELRQEVEKIFVGNEEYGNFIITVLSFGFKYGIPSDADLVFDVRFLPNPFYIPDLRNLTGLDSKVADYVLGNEETHKFLNAWENLLNCVMPGYVAEGKQQLAIGVGCTGGQHRSVVLANKTAELLAAQDYNVNVYHRDIALADTNKEVEK